MDAQRQQILSFLRFEGVNPGYIAHQLYGEKNKRSVSKLYNKVNELQGRTFSDDEIIKLIDIRKKFFENIL
jgi:hypothetical protein